MAGETLSLIKRVHWRDPQGPRMYTNPPNQESVPEGPNLIVGSGGVTENQQRVEQVPLLPLHPSPTYSFTAQRPALPRPSEHLRLCPFMYRHAKTKKKKKGPNERTDQSSRKNTLSNQEIANQSDAQFKTLVIRMLTVLVEFGHKLDEKMKAMLRETKENVQGTNSEAKETETEINQMMVWTRRKKETSNQKRMKKQQLRKMRRGLGTSRTS